MMGVELASQGVNGSRDIEKRKGLTHLKMNSGGRSSRKRERGGNRLVRESGQKGGGNGALVDWRIRKEPTI